MNTITDSTNGQSTGRWRPFLLLLLLFVVDTQICGLLPTPDSWSDGRSQWLPPVAMGVTVFCLCIAVHWVYRRPGFIFKIQALVLWLLFGTVLGMSAYGIYDSLTFRREVKANEIRQSSR
jgi:F0F1-type ATP synthase membrane subunit a